jgi:hypothetical protein
MTEGETREKRGYNGGGGGVPMDCWEIIWVQWGGGGGGVPMDCWEIHVPFTNFYSTLLAVLKISEMQHGGRWSACFVHLNP